MVKPQPAFMKT